MKKNINESQNINQKIKKMINDKYKYQSQVKTEQQSNVWRQWIENILPKPKLNANKQEQKLSNNTNEQDSKNFNTIKSSEQQIDLLKINYLDSKYGSNSFTNNYQEFQNQKIIISKSQLIVFSQQFACQKLQLQKQITKIRQYNSQLQNSLNFLEQQSKKQKIVIQEKQNLIKILKIKNEQEIQSFKAKIREQMLNFTQIQKQFNLERAKNFQFKKRYQFLEDKLKYQEDQATRLQKLLKIKEDIIQNYQWQKSVHSARKLEKSVKKQCEQIKQCSDIKSDNKTIKTNRNNQINTMSVNQTLDLSQINANHSLSSFEITYKQENQKYINNPLKKYTIGKKTPSSGTQSKAKLNISLQKNRNTHKVQKQRQISYQKQGQSMKSKTKSIIIKRNSNNSFTEKEKSVMEKQKDEKINELTGILNQKQIQFISNLKILKQQNESLKGQLLQVSQNFSIESGQLNLLKESKRNYTIQNQVKAKLEKKNSMLKQKCVLLQNQIEKTIRKYITIEERNQYLQNAILKLKQPQFSKSLYLEQRTEQQKPMSVLKDLITPQFRQSQFKANFFAKTNNLQLGLKPFENVHLEQLSQKSFLDTFNRNNPSATINQIHKEGEDISQNKNRIIQEFQIENDQQQKNQLFEQSEVICPNEESLQFQGNIAS